MPKMSLNEALAEGFQVTGIGLIIVFAVLIILMLVMMAMKGIFYKPDKPEVKSEPKPEPKPAKKASVEKVSPATEEVGMDEGTLVAVLAAAIAASIDVPVGSLKIKSYKRVGSALPAWNRAGVRDIIDSRF